MNIEEIIEWDVYNWSQALKFWQNSTKIDLKKASALEIGSRNGGLSLWLSSIFKKVICSDVGQPNEKCLSLHKKYNIENITYKELDAFVGDFPKKLDVVVSKSTLSFFDEKKIVDVIDNIYNSLNDCGEYWFAENLIASPIHSFFRRKFTPWAYRWNYLLAEDLPVKFAKFSNLQYITVGISGLFGRSNFQRNLLGMFDKYILERIFPKSYRYIVIGVATK